MQAPFTSLSPVTLCEIRGIAASVPLPHGPRGHLAVVLLPAHPYARPHRVPPRPGPAGQALIHSPVYHLADSVRVDFPVRVAHSGAADLRSANPDFVRRIPVGRLDLRRRFALVVAAPPIPARSRFARRHLAAAVRHAPPDARLHGDAEAPGVAPYPARYLEKHDGQRRA